MVDARPARRAMILFSLALVATTAELGWWWVLNIRTAAQERALHYGRLEGEARLAEHLLSGTQNLSEERQWLQTNFPRLSVTCAQAQLPCRVAPKETEISALRQQFAARVRMFIGEGAFLILMLVTGAMLMLRAMRREVLMVRQQSNFLAAVTHELKSPLATIRLYVETLRRRSQDSEQKARYLATLEKETHRLEALVNNVLLASRLSAPRKQRKKTSYAPIDVADVTEQAILKQNEPLGDPLIFEKPDTPLWVRIDTSDWQTICRNLVDNAYKYGGHGKPITIRLLKHQDDVVLEVIDEGTGLTPSDQKRVFDKFFRVGDELARRHEGSGLGLYLVRQLADAAGGQASVSSKGLHCGAAFCVRVPYAHRGRVLHHTSGAAAPLPKRLFMLGKVP